MLLAVLSATAAEAQATAAGRGRVVLPEGSVIIVRTTAPLESNTARVGQAFETIVADTVRADNFTVIPAGSRIRGVVTFAQPADRQRSGVIEVNFDRLTLPDGAVLPLSGKLTSTDAAERRQIESDPNARVVLVGGRGGVGATIAGAGSENTPASGILAALGTLLSQARDVRVPRGTPLAVQLEQRLVLSRRGAARSPDSYTIYTAEDRIRAAQQALARQNYYRGAVTGQLDDATQRALFEFQVDKGIIATGNLDGRTAQALGINATAPGGATGRAVLSAEEASLLRRAGQALVGRYRQDMAVSTTGRLDAGRAYDEGDMELWFALSAFADNSSLYEQLVRVPGNASGSEAAGRALVGAARRVDAAMQGAGASQAVQSAWASMRRQLAELDPAYR
ncbi:peptidoglycan-binding domain-containing protein [Longimicrobium sp.]|uniref:peptidoglycan-binding domain-containing protein n=1 Tax=Longimicrobium sp. TaxID=2029185 RepID=UPI002C826382|nr:peptidoglycan-binding domain-containing protein [Longimicrobium sp.]HSU16744.1 peptidoglycan-binding domain-containing protein [Longimicrobium sp.]